jgi:hypothetical protein
LQNNRFPVAATPARTTRCFFFVKARKGAARQITIESPVAAVRIKA